MNTRSVENRTKCHPNRVPFAGVLTLVGVVSDKSPSGARGHRVILTRKAARTALSGLRGMGVNYAAGWEGHDVRQKVGVIERAWIDGEMLRVSGYLFGRDFPEVVATVARGGTSKDVLGMSYELAEAHVADMRKTVWTLTRCIFTGAAILLREKAAYRETSFCLVEKEFGLRLAASSFELRSIVDEYVEQEAQGCEDEVRDQD